MTPSASFDQTLKAVGPTTLARGFDSTVIQIRKALENAVTQAGTIPLIGSSLSKDLQPILNQLD